MDEDKFPWNADETVEGAYFGENFKIKYTGAKTQNAIIFFSSNGLYFPNTKEVFKNVVSKENRFEWENVSSNEKIQKHFSKIIFLRDIYKQWYLRGINSKLSTQDAVIEFLKKETKGYKVTVAGNSAGGYMALVSGLLINACKIFSFAGQFDITDRANDDNPFVKAAYALNQELSALKYINKENAASVFYFFPAFSNEDLKQYKLIKDFNLNVFKMDEKVHGGGVMGCCFPYLFTSDEKRLIALAKSFRGKIIKKKELTRKVLPLYKQIERVFLKK